MTQNNQIPEIPKYTQVPEIPKYIQVPDIPKKKMGCGKMLLIGFASIIGLFLIISIISGIVGVATMTPEEYAAAQQKRDQESFTEQVELVNKAHEKAKSDILKNIKNNEYYAESHVKVDFEYIIKPYLKDPESLQVRSVQLIRTEKYNSYVTTKYSDYIKDFSCDTTLRNKELRDTLQVPIQIYNVTYGAKNSFGGYVVNNATVRLNLETNEVFIGKD